MKLTEQKLAQLFQESTQNHKSTGHVGDCLTHPNLVSADAIANDFQAAQSAKLAIQFQPWSQQVADDIERTHNVSWQNRIQTLIKSLFSAKPMTATAMAMVLTLSAVVFFNNNQSVTPTSDTNVVTNDIINNMPFEGQSDRLSRAGFDAPEKTDHLFDANFS